MMTGKVKIGIEEFKEDIISTCHRPPFSRRIPRLKWCEHQFWKRSNVFFVNSADHCTWLVWYMYFYWSVPLITMHRWVPIWTLRPLSSVSKPYIFHMFECLLWRIKLRLSFYMLISLFRIELDPMADSACHRRCRFHVHRWEMILTLRPLYSVSKPNISRVWMSIVKGWARAFIWYARLSIQSRIGSDGWLRVPSSMSISCASVGEGFDFEAPSIGE